MLYPYIDEAAIRKFRLERTRQQLQQNDIGAIVLFDPINIRYATGSRNMQVWTSHTLSRHALVFASGPVVLFENGGAMHLSRHLETLDEIRPAKWWISAERSQEHVGWWADEIVDLFRQHCGADARLAVDRSDLLSLTALQDRGVRLVNGVPPMLKARAIKSDEEIRAIRQAMRACTDSIAAMREMIVPGVTEAEALAALNRENIARGGEHQETRLLSSGPRTNPWWQETSDRVLENGDLLVFDTDLIGLHGIFCDQTRAWVVGDRRPTDEQRRLYTLAREQLEYNVALIKPGLSFHEMAEKSWKMPDIYVPNRYAEIVHGIGLTGEYPLVYYPQDVERWQYRGHFEENMVVCVESYIGAVGGREGVKLEQPLVVTRNGVVPIESYQYEEDYH